MKIHYSAKFSGYPEGHHGCFEVALKKEQIESNKEQIVSLAIGNCRTKCKEVFGMNFEEMDFFEVFYYDCTEVSIFKKQKE